jgi:hypothetical protein
MCGGRRNDCVEWTVLLPVSKGNGRNKLERRGRGVLIIIVYYSNDGDKMMRRMEKIRIVIDS